MKAEVLAVVLGLVSAVTLALVNTAVKIAGDILVARSVLSVTAALVTLPGLLLVGAPDPGTVAALVWAIPAHLFYQFCLVRAMTHGDLSLVFPVMRGLAPLLTAISAWGLLGERLNPAGWAALLVATAAIIVFALPPRGVSLRRHPDARALLWAGGTAIGVALYSATDARGVRAGSDPLDYIVWLFLLDWVGITLVALTLRRRAYLAAAVMQWRTAVTAGLLSVASFGAALFAMTLVEVAKVSALRETAVVFAALMGALLLKEGFGGRRIAAAAVLAAALIALQFAG
ncbi:EamA family transporter [Sphingomonas changnyeongensis]|uniref:EamA family transporter n=1 Tax=Sphingomonas changnyeongensis TaxID=2698679 RepID=A0A7Z2S510_9SPHN|nr:DMT family transporter [Sphingomonas changnyeongensis]QHL89863.1 EamA family transporter [Sphingomonas changnyeongensis]